MIVPRTVGRWLNILDYAAGSLARRPGKNFLVGAVFALVVFLFASFQLMQGGLQEMATTLLAHAPDITVQQLTAGRQSSIARSAETELASIYGIRSLEQRVWGYYFDESNGANYTVVGLSDKGLQRAATTWTQQVEGHLPEATEPGQVVISDKVHRLLGLGDRRRFSLFRPDLSMSSFTVVGTFAPDAEAVAADMILTSLDDAHDLFQLDAGKVTDLLVEVANPLEIDTVAKKIADRLPGVRVVTRPQIEKTYRAVFGYRSGLGIVCLLTALVAFAILAWDKGSGLSAEDLREVAILKVLGWQTGDILLLRFCESLIITVFSFGVGYLGAWLHLIYAHGGLFRPIMLGWSVLRPEIRMVPPFIWSDLLLVFSFSVIPYLCATAIPGWRAAVIRAEGAL